jgi:ankyrin repeat protein
MAPRVFLLLLLPLLTLSCGSIASGEPEQLPPRTVSGSTSATDADIALLEATANNDLTGLRWALENGAAVDARDKDRRTALLIATYANHVDVAAALIEAGADVNAKDAIQDSPYLYAAAEGRLEILRLTLQHGADLKSTNRYGGTGLIPAAHHGHPDVVRELLTTSVNIDHVNNLGWTALLEAVILGNGDAVHTQIVRLLMDAGADVSIPDRGGLTALDHARRSGYRDMTAVLESAKARP